MNKNTENVVMVALPPTLVAAIVLAVIAAVAFRMGQPTAGFVFSLLSVVAWIALLVEFFLVYNALVERWFSRDRSVVAAVWFVVSLWLAFVFTPDKGVDWPTAVTVASLFAVIFLVPYTIGMAYGSKIKSWMKGLWSRMFPNKSTSTDSGAEALPCRSTTIDRRMSQEEEIDMYDKLIADISPEVLRSLPEALQPNDALFLLVLFREDGYLSREFRPVIKKGEEIHHSLYAFIANTIASALKMNVGKWPIFEEFWSLKNAAQLVSNWKRNEPNEHQKRIAKLMRKATRLRPKLETYKIRELMAEC